MHELDLVHVNLGIAYTVSPEMIFSGIEGRQLPATSRQRICTQWAIHCRNELLNDLPLALRRHA